MDPRNLDLERDAWLFLRRRSTGGVRAHRPMPTAGHASAGRGAGARWVDDARGGGSWCVWNPRRRHRNQLQRDHRQGGRPGLSDTSSRRQGSAGGFLFELLGRGRSWERRLREAGIDEAFALGLSCNGACRANGALHPRCDRVSRRDARRSGGPSQWSQSAVPLGKALGRNGHGSADRSAVGGQDRQWVDP